MPNYTLVNAETRANNHPSSFLIPNRPRRERVVPGYHVKLIFENGRDGERMWVLVTGMAKIDEAITFTGVLHNDPVQLEGVKYGDAVRFGPEHIADIQVGTDG